MTREKKQRQVKEQFEHAEGGVGGAGSGRGFPHSITKANNTI